MLHALRISRCSHYCTGRCTTAWSRGHFYAAVICSTQDSLNKRNRTRRSLLEPTDPFCEMALRPQEEKGFYHKARHAAISARLMKASILRPANSAGHAPGGKNPPFTGIKRCAWLAGGCQKLHLETAWHIMIG
jgi:hypothetical protein